VSSRLSENSVSMPLKIALVDSDADRAEALERQLSDAGFADVSLITSGPDLAAAIVGLAPDLVIVDMALPDRDALEGIRLVSGTHPIVMFAGGDDVVFAEEAIAAGVCSYNLSGAAISDIKPIIMSAIALFRRYRRVEEELEATKALLDERRIIERAKAILMRNRKMTEPEAYGWLRRNAMNQNRKVGQVATDLVNKEEADGQES
jgi:two-component system, response regulator / RNA-binding antiterminator